MSRLTRVSTKKSSFIPTHKFSPPPVLQPKAEIKPDAKLPEWKPGGGGATNPVQRLLNRYAVQTKLTIGQPNDKYEPEADRVASQVMSTPTPTPEMKTALAPDSENPIQRQCADCAKEEEEQKGEEKKDLEEIGIQTKLTIGAPGDAYEQEADRIAAKVMSMPAPADSSASVQRSLEANNPNQIWQGAQSITPVVQRQIDSTVQIRRMLQWADKMDGNHQASGDLESRLNASKGGGSPLSEPVRRFMEPRFGADFSSVRVHTGSVAVQMNQELGAQAFTHGSDVYFGAGKSPGNNELTAHELTHVVQQTGVVQRQLNGHIQKTPTTHPTLRRGSRGSFVEELQQKLNTHGAAPPLAVDGIFGPLTHAAVVQLQQTHQDSTGTPLAPDGIVGPLTWGALDQVVPTPTPTPPTPTPSATPQVTIGSVTYGTTPNRLPPTQSASVQVKVSGLTSGQAIKMDIEGSGGANGSATITSGNQISSNQTVTIQGGTQTAPGNAGNLKLRAILGGNTLARSAGFTVAAYPQNWVNTRVADINSGGALGVQVQDNWSSDGSGSISELDEVDISELVGLQSRDNPPFTSNAGTSTTSGTSGYLPGDQLTTDRHSYGRARINTSSLASGTYTIVYTQLSVFRCNRTLVNDQVMPASGYTITHRVWHDTGLNQWKHQTIKTGAATTVGGHSATAGAGGGNSNIHTL